MNSSSDPRPRGTSSVDREHPWPGLSAYTEESQEYFHGRSAEARDLLDNIRRRPLALLYGLSGLGKTSLLQAGLFPKLRGERFLPVPLRIDYSPEAPEPAEQVKRTISKVITEAYPDGKPPLPGNETLWEYFHQVDSRLVDSQGRPVSLVLVFDQFEELFTIGQQT